VKLARGTCSIQDVCDPLRGQLGLRDEPDRRASYVEVGDICLAVGGDEHDRGAVVRRDGGRDVDPALEPEIDVDEDDVHLKLAHELDRFGSGRDQCDHLEPLLGEEIAGCFEELLVVIDDQEAQLSPSVRVWFHSLARDAKARIPASRNCALPATGPYRCPLAAMKPNVGHAIVMARVGVDWEAVMEAMSKRGMLQIDGFGAGRLTLAGDEGDDDMSSHIRRSADRVLFATFVDARARARGPVVCVNSRVIAWNAAAVPLVARRDHGELWQWARHAIDAQDSSSRPLRLRDLALNARCEGVFDGFELVGAMIRLDARPVADGGSDRRPAKPECRSFGWESLRESELGIAQLVSDGLTNREIAARVFLSRHTVDSHLRQIFRKLGISSRVELTRLVVEHGATGAPSAA